MPSSSRPPTSRLTRRVPVVAPYRLDLTANVLRRLSSNVVDHFSPDGTYARVLAGDAGPAVVTVRQREPAVLEVSVDAAADRTEGAAAVVARILGVDRDVRPFARRAAKIPWLRALARRMRGVKPPRYPTLWEAVVNAVVFQQISLFAAAAILRRMIEALGTAISYDGEMLHAFPEPGTVLAAGARTLSQAGLSAAKIATLQRGAAAILDGTLEEKALENRTSAEAVVALTSIKGIGPWTATVILLRGLGRLDVFPMKDSGMARGLLRIAGPGVDLDGALAVLGDQRGLLYYHVLLAWLESRGELSS